PDAACDADALLQFSCRIRKLADIRLRGAERDVLPRLLKRVAHLVGHRPGLCQQLPRRARPMLHQVAEAQELQAVRLGPAVAAGPGEFQARREQRAARTGVDHERGRGEYVQAPPWVASSAASFASASAVFASAVARSKSKV